MGCTCSGNIAGCNVINDLFYPHPTRERESIRVDEGNKLLPDRNCTLTLTFKFLLNIALLLRRKTLD